MKDRDTQKLSRWLLRMVMIIFTAAVVVPIFWTFSSAFKTSEEFLSSPWGLPSGLHWNNFYNAIVKANMGAYFVTSVWVTLLSLGGLLMVTIMGSYALSRFSFKLNKLITLLIMAGLFINANYLVVPIFLQLKNGFLDNRLVLCIVYVGTALPFYVFLLSNYLRSVPKDYEEAAVIDGCGHWATMMRVIVPMTRSGLVTVAMFGFMAFWNEYMLALTLISTPDKRTLPVGLSNLMEIQRYATDWGAMFAGMVLVMLPTMLVYAVVQKRLTSGLAVGGVKG